MSTAFDTSEKLWKILQTIRYRNFRFESLQDGEHVFLVVKFDAADFKTGEMYENISRRWYISPHMTFSEVVKTIWLAICQVEEHERRENFIVHDAVGNTCRPFNPHHAIEKLMALNAVEYGLYAEKDAE